MMQSMALGVSCPQISLCAPFLLSDQLDWRQLRAPALPAIRCLK